MKEEPRVVSPRALVDHREADQEVGGDEVAAVDCARRTTRRASSVQTLRRRHRRSLKYRWGLKDVMSRDKGSSATASVHMQEKAWIVWVMVSKRRALDRVVG